MNAYNFTRNGHRFTRIAKPAAAKAWTEGKTIAFCPAKLSPVFLDGVFRIELSQPELRARHPYASESELSFEYTRRNFEWYNCGSHETGYYAAYYLVEPIQAAVA